jgi:sterol desaturase/sphingolipid hydroxylase (fatty acid hydroxylase superfamily)
MTFEELFPILMPSTFAAFLILERLVPGRELPRVRGWLLKGIAFFLLVGGTNAILPALALEALGSRTVFHLSSVGTFGGALLVLLANDLLGYGIHRGLHNSERAWLWTHQLHHSAERMDMAGSSLFHPFDVLAMQVLPTVLISAVLGVTPLAAAIGGFAGFVFGVSPHLNVRTPQWLGYVIQRPEMHAVHHQRGVHAYNYGVLALSDLVFGTWRNPATFHDGEFGFWDGASATVARMLIGRDVSQPPRAERAEPNIAPGTAPAAQ